MLRTAIWVLLLTPFFSSPLVAQRAYHSYSQDHRVVSLRLPHYAKQMYQLNLLQIDIAGVDLIQRVVDVNVTEKELEGIKKYIPEIEILSPETQMMLGGIFRPSPRGPDSQYLTLEKIEVRLKDLQSRFPNLMATKVIGKSLEGRNIYAVKLSENVQQNDPKKPNILFNSMHHSREVMTAEVAIDTIETLLGYNSKSRRVNNYLKRNQIWIVPMLNVDGNHIVWHKDSMWRKNSRGGYGVDINRNYPFDWNACGGSSGSKYSQTYRGDSPASEPETQALMKLVEAIRPVFNISYHSYSELVLYPYSCRSKHTPQGSMVREVGHELAKRLPKDGAKGHYVAGTSWEILYSVDGGDIDWMYANYNVLPYVIELNSRSEGFQPNYKTWRDRTVLKARNAWAYLLDRVEGSGVRGYVQTAKRSKSEIMVAIKSLDNPSMHPHVRKVNPDGTFHLVLAPGSYQLTLSDGQLTKPPVAINVGQTRIDQAFTF